MADESKVWLITGCSTGFGREMARLLIERGDRVVATARRSEQLRELVDGHTNAFAVGLDVSDTDTITEAVGQALTHFGRIDVLVNNAGYGYLAAVEEGEYEEVRKIFETNFFGLIELTKEVLPGMREQRSGTIVNVSSIGGLMSFAATGYYHATKFAVEGISESLALEVEPLGIRVMIVEPGPFRTDWAGRSILESKVEIADYKETAGKRREQTRERSGNQQGDPVRGAQAIITAVDSGKPPRHLLLGKPALEMAYKRLETLKADFDASRELTLSADYPEFQDAQG